MLELWLKWFEMAFRQRIIGRLSISIGFHAEPGRKCINSTGNSIHISARVDNWIGLCLSKVAEVI